jgi:hypothetical protein
VPPERESTRDGAACDEPSGESELSPTGALVEQGRDEDDRTPRTAAV